MSNSLWCVVERDGERNYVSPEEVFTTRAEARNYLKVLKQQIQDVRNYTAGQYGIKTTDLFIRKLSLTGKRG